MRLGNLSIYTITKYTRIKLYVIIIWQGLLNHDDDEDDIFGELQQHTVYKSQV